MYFDDEANIVYIGFDQGKVVRLKIGENPVHYTEMTELSTHTLRITGIHANKEAGTFTTVSDDALMKVTEGTSGSVVFHLQPSPNALKQLVKFQQRNCFAISDAKGNLHLYNSTGSPEHLISLQVDSRSEIKGLALNGSENYIAAGCQDGTINIFDLGAPGKERLAKLFVCLQGKTDVRCLQWREKPRRELIAGHADGIVTIWDFKQQKPIFVLQAHTSAITKMEWHEDKQALLTCAKDKCFKIWQFPNVWVDENSVNLQMPPDSKIKRVVASKPGASSGAETSVVADDESDDSDDGLGRIRTNGRNKKNTLPAGLGQVFNMNNPLAAKPKPVSAAQSATSKPLNNNNPLVGAQQQNSDEREGEEETKTSKSDKSKGSVKTEA